MRYPGGVAVPRRECPPAERSMTVREALLRLCLLLTPSTSSTLTFGRPDDGRHDDPDPHGPPLRAQDPPRPGARKPGVAAPTGRPPARRAASTPTNLRPPVLGPAVPPVERLGGCRLHRPPRDRHPLAAVGLQAVLDLEELAKMSRPPGRRPGDPSAHSHDDSRQPPVGCAADS